ncbi:urocanate hydratase [Neophocaena asiaeorientalis asiaeorientalis]|uniref:Urocanate hydratase n=1 Tax=Neophocaena asiaeorientalis asiaeorientalis TaxID=1706337 RepID=A0A341CWQ3_NEOAA|nr:urocanate hydratase [Neophocaena asiaeorientalis asiaeorientalis]
MSRLQALCSGLPLRPLPENRGRRAGVPHAPVRTPGLSPAEEQLALRNALRYFPPDTQELLAPEFAQELRLYGHIYMYRFCPDIEMKAYPVEQYPCRTRAAAAIMHMIMNNLDPAVAQFPQELVTYGGNGQVFSNWAQFWLTMSYLSQMTEEQTLVMYSGHPLGLFPSSPGAPRLVITNGMVIPNYSSRMEYEKLFAMGVTIRCRRSHSEKGTSSRPDALIHSASCVLPDIPCSGEKFKGGRAAESDPVWLPVSADPRRCEQLTKEKMHITIEVDGAALMKRHKQGWLMEVTDSLDRCIERLREARKRKEALSLGYHGNVVDLWERLVCELDTTGELLVDLGSDQTSCHNPFNGGYYPVQLGFAEAQSLMASDPAAFKALVQESLRRHVSAINRLAQENFFFWDYGNAFLLEAQRAGADVGKTGANRTEFRYPSYVQHIMGDIFSQGFGPFRWVCTSGDPQDLVVTDQLATSVLEEAIAGGVNPAVEQQYVDNIRWIREASQHRLVVGSQARILYSDQKGRVAIAVAFNQAIARGKIKAPVVLSRDHHDVSGTDSPFRETSNICDGSAFCADMAVQNFVGGAFRGATWVALHNGGGVGWGEVINGGFGLVLDGTQEAEQKAKMMLSWDVSNGVARRCWSGNPKAYEIICQTMQEDRGLVVTLPHEVADERVLQRALRL